MVSERIPDETSTQEELSTCDGLTVSALNEFRKGVLKRAEQAALSGKVL